MVSDEERAERRALGERLREFRLEQRLSLAEAASQSGISASFISYVETGKGDITFGKLKRLVDAYGKSLHDLASDGRENLQVIRSGQERRLLSPTEGFTMKLLAPHPPKSMQVVLGIAEPGAGMKEFTPVTESEQWYHVLQGSLRLTFEATGEELVLNKGDSAYLDGRMRKKVVNNSRGRTISLFVVTPPIM